jgi:hypothetical protein
MDDTPKLVIADDRAPRFAGSKKIARFDSPRSKTREAAHF